jgi:hypothetical protein
LLEVWRQAGARLAILPRLRGEDRRDNPPAGAQDTKAPRQVTHRKSPGSARRARTFSARQSETVKRHRGLPPEDPSDPVIYRTDDGVEWTRSGLVAHAERVLQDPTSDPFARASAHAFLAGQGPRATDEEE